MSTKKFLLQEKDIPTAWYNIVADMKTKPLPPLNPQTHEPMKEEDFYPLFAKELSHQEMNQTDAWIEIPEQVRDMYKIWRPTPLVRAYGLEKYLDTPAHIYFKNESVSPVGSHKLNSAIAQAYFCKKEGVTNITTETGAGQWGAALSFAAKAFGLELAVYMVKVDHADVRRTSHRFAQYEYQSRTQNSYRTPQLSGQSGYGHLRSRRTGHADPKLQIYPRQRTQPCHAAPDRHRPRS